MLHALSILSHAGMESEGEVLAYGSGVLLLGAGLYVAPVAVLMRLRGIQWWRFKDFFLPPCRMCGMDNPKVALIGGFVIVVALSVAVLLIR